MLGFSDHDFFEGVGVDSGCGGELLFNGLAVDEKSTTCTESSARLRVEPWASLRKVPRDTWTCPLTASRF